MAVKRVIPPRVVAKRKKAMHHNNRFAQEGHPKQEKAMGDLETGSQGSQDSLAAATGVSLTLGSRSTTHHSGSRFTSIFFGDDYSRLKKDFVSEMRYLSKLRHPCITTVMGTLRSCLLDSASQVSMSHFLSFIFGDSLLVLPSIY